MFLRPAVQSDLPDIARIYLDAHFDDEFSAILAPYRHDYPASYYVFFLTGIKQRFFNPKQRVTVAVAEAWDAERWGVDVREKEVIGVAQWAVQGVAGTSDQRQAGLAHWFETNAAAWEKWYRSALRLERAIDRTNQMMITKVYTEDKSFDEYPSRLNLKGLAVTPKCQGKRVGSALILEMKRIASECNIPVGLTSKRASHELYLRHGFKEIGAVKFPGTGVGQPAMIWEPEQKLKVDKES